MSRIVKIITAIAGIVVIAFLIWFGSPSTKEGNGSATGATAVSKALPDSFIRIVKVNSSEWTRVDVPLGYSIYANWGYAPVWTKVNDDPTIIKVPLGTDADAGKTLRNFYFMVKPGPESATAEVVCEFTRIRRPHRG